jgi:hypothetical protein
MLSWRHKSSDIAARVLWALFVCWLHASVFFLFAAYSRSLCSSGSNKLSFMFQLSSVSGHRCIYSHTIHSIQSGQCHAIHMPMDWTGESIYPAFPHPSFAKPKMVEEKICTVMAIGRPYFPEHKNSCLTAQEISSFKLWAIKSPTMVYIGIKMLLLLISILGKNVKILRVLCHNNSILFP